MIILDENILESQRQLLHGWHVIGRQIGHDIGRKGIKDMEVIPFLLHLRQPTFFTLDFDFYEPSLCHRRYCLVCMHVKKHEAATFVRRVLRHSEFDTAAKRMGQTMRVSSMGISVWHLHAEKETFFRWVD